MSFAKLMEYIVAGLSNVLIGEHLDAVVGH